MLQLVHDDHRPNARFACYSICCPFAIAAASFDLVFGLKLESPPGTHISVEVVRFLQLPILSNNVLYHQ